MNRAAIEASTNPANEIHERDHVGEEEGDTLAAQRQELDVEHVDDDEHRQQDELRPLCRVAEEEAHLLEHQLPAHYSPRREQARHESAERALSYPCLLYTSPSPRD